MHSNAVAAPNRRGRLVLVGALAALLVPLLVLIPARADTAGLAVSVRELIFSGVKGTTSAAQTITLTNTGAEPLTIDSAILGGTHAADFAIAAAPTLPAAVAPGAALTFDVAFAPGATTVGSLSAVFSAASSAASVDVALYGLSANGEQGGNEPPLQQVVDTLGYAIDVGGAKLILGTGPEPIGDEILAPVFTKAADGPVTMTPVARYSPDDRLPFGFYTPGNAQSATPIATLALDQEQTLNPRIDSGGLSFDPGSAPFGLFAGATSYAGVNTYTEDTLNTGPITHAARVYPLNDRAGLPLPGSFLVAFEPASNGDYQDYVFVVANVQPVAAATPTPAPTVAPTATSAPATPAIHINTGGPAQTVDGVSWLECSAIDACNGYVSGGFAYHEADQISGVQSPVNQTILQSEWTGGCCGPNPVAVGATAFTFNVPVSNGEYLIRLHFVELNKYAAGTRVFDVNFEGGAVELPGFDLWQAAGGIDRAIVREFPVTITDGAATIAFVRQIENAKISAIEILPAAPGAAPTAAPAPTATNAPAPTATSAPPTATSVPAPTSAPSATINWTTKANAPVTVYEAQGLAASGKLYVFGGFYNGQTQATLQSSVYDPATDMWQRIADLPEKLTHAGQALDGETIWLAGGFVGDHPGPSTTSVWKYNIRSNSWSKGPALPAPRAGGGLVRIDRTLHYFGGTVREKDVYKVDAPDHWVLNLDGGTSWRAVAPLPNPANHMAGVALNGLVYAIGGQRRGDEHNGNQNAVYSYDPTTDQWTRRANLPRPLGHITASTFIRNGRIVVAGGVTQGQIKVAHVIEYDPATNTWRELTKLPAPRQSPVADLIGKQIVVATGRDDGPKKQTWIGQ